ncbi:MFS transporter [Marinithermofilum abyssi]|uniref:MFS transporter n=1 Tax=Marinithermofilum abyssi TaxID=1571185 RepID=A0A8J2VHH9_9BACL|nr:MFS transporter [Marinithermofilum abyssi]GGE22641.1 MFS transporter [Marinithermofilum abyssi]
MPLAKKMSLDTFIIAIFLSALDIGMIAPSLTAIVGELHFPVRWAVWVIALHLAILVLALPLMETWSARVGRQKWFICALLFFAVGSFVAGSSRSWTVLILGRALQALGAGGIVPLLSFEIRRLSHLRKSRWRMVAHILFAFLLILVPAGSVWITIWLGWRWLFWINIAVALILFAVSFRWGSKSYYRTSEFHIHGLLYFGIMLLCAMIALTRLDPARGAMAWTEPAVLPWAILAVGAAIPLMMVERRAKQPIFAANLLADGRLFVMHGVLGLSGFSWVAIIFVPGGLVSTLHRTFLIGGMFLSVIFLSAWAVIPLVRWLSSRMGYQSVLVVGFLGTSSAYLTLGLVKDPYVSVGMLFLLGAGMGCTLAAPVHELLFQILPPRKVQPSLVVTGMSRAAGAALGLVIMGMAFYQSAPFPFAQQGSGILPQAWQHGYETAMLMAASASVLGLILSLMLQPSTSSNHKKS